MTVKFAAVQGAKEEGGAHLVLVAVERVPLGGGEAVERLQGVEKRLPVLVLQLTDLPSHVLRKEKKKSARKNGGRNRLGFWLVLVEHDQASSTFSLLI